MDKAVIFLKAQMCTYRKLAYTIFNIRQGNTMRFKFLLFIFMWAMMAMAQNNDYSYIFQDETVYLNLSGDALSVRFNAPLNDAQARSVLQTVLGSRLKKIEHLYENNSRLVYLNSRYDPERYNALLNRLRTLPEVLQVAPVFRRGHFLSVVTDQFIVRFESGISRNEIDAINSRRGVAFVRKIAVDTYLLSASKSSGMNALGASRLYHDLARVKWAQPNFVYPNYEILNSDDPHYGQQWAHLNSGQAVANGLSVDDRLPTSVKGFTDADMDVDEAWNILAQKGLLAGEKILIGIIDSGIELAHPDLMANIADPGRDFTSDNQNDGNDTQGHGTAVAGVIAAIADNGIGVAGIANHAQLLPVKINSTWGGASDADIAAAIDYAWQFGCDVLSNSWSGTEPSQVIIDAIQRAKTQGRNGLGCVVVFSSGNEGHGTVSFPAYLSDVIAVGASNMFDEKKNQGSRDYNRKWGGNYGADLDLVAPTLVYTTDLVGKNGFNPGDYDDSFSGTSASCPHVSATAALVLGVDPSLTSDQVQDILQRSADKIDRYMIDTKGWNKHVGYGRVNARNAVKLALGDDGDVPLFSFTKPVSGTDTAARDVSVNLSDASGIGRSVLYYRSNYRGAISAWIAVDGNLKTGDTYIFTIPGQQWETEVDYYFYAEDKAGNFVTFPADGDLNSPPPLYFSYHVAELRTSSYNSVDVPLATNAATTFYTSTLNVKDSYNIVDVDATVSFSATNLLDDFAIDLEAPSGLASGILQRNPGKSYSNTGVDDEAKVAITAGTDPYNGSFQPDNALWNFDGDNSAGTWTLRVYDDVYFNNGGNLSAWGINITSMVTNDVPVVGDIPDQTITEGQTFNSIDLNKYVSDGNHSNSQISWSYSGNTQLIVSIDLNNIATVSLPDSEWNGSETISFIATDPGAATDSDPATFTVNGINDRPRVSDIPDQNIQEGATFTTISLDSYVSDPDNADSEMSWSYSGNSSLTVSINTARVATVSTPNADWNGSEIITFTATDPGNLSAGDPAGFTVSAVNDTPLVTDIPDQTIDEGGNFTTIALDNYVSDVDNADSELTWSYSGNSSLTVSISAAHVATVSTPNADWYGSESISFIATDPAGASDNDPAVFVVNGINDPPQVSDIPDQTIAEGATFATIILDNYVSDPDNADSELTWSYSGNSSLTVSINTARVATISTPNADWNGSETITFSAKDPANLAGSDPATFSITAVNDAPVVSGIPNQSISEGGAFQQINLDTYVSDVDNSDAEMTWSYSGNSSLIVSIDNNHLATIQTPSSNWNGSETIAFTATDPGGKSDSDAAVFSAGATNDPPMISDIPDQTIDEGASFSTIALDNYVSDPDNADSELTWSYSGNSSLTVSISTNRVASIGIPNADWNGGETITFTVRDPGGLTDTDPAIFTVSAVNDTPLVSDIPGQTIDEGGTFQQINLDNYVSDVDNSDAEMTWSYSGNSGLIVSIDSTHLATIRTPSADWNGSENITFTVQDPSGLTDADPAIFTVSAVNDAPLVSDIPGQTIDEGGTFQQINLDNYVSDVDNSDAEMSWSYSGNSGLIVSIDNNHLAMIQTPSSNWNGSESIRFKATDPDGLFDSDSAIFSVQMVNTSPIVSDSLPQVSGHEDEGASYPKSNWYPYVTDADNSDDQLLFYVRPDQPAEITVSETNGVFSFQAPKDWNGTGTFRLIVSDGVSSDSAGFTVKLSAVNDAPQIHNMPDSLVFVLGSVLTQDLSGFEQDVDSPAENLIWSFTTPEERVQALVNNKDKSLELSAMDFVGSAPLYAVLLDDSSARAYDTLTVVVKDKPTALKKRDVLPETTTLYQNYPNPFNPATRIAFSLPQRMTVRLSIFDATGKLLRILVEGSLEAGRHHFAFAAHGLASGVYIYRLEAGNNFVQTKKLLLIR